MRLASPCNRTLLVQPDGRILAVGRGNNELGMARYTPDGILDPAFGAGGTARLRTGLSFNTGMDAALLPDGRILIVSADRNFFAALYTQDGTLIHSALTASRTNKTYDYLEAVQLQSDGKIVGVGRLAPDSPQPGSDAWWDLNDVIVVRSIDAQQILPEPAGLAGLLVAAVMLGRRRRR